MNKAKTIMVILVGLTIFLLISIIIININLFYNPCHGMKNSIDSLSEKIGSDIASISYQRGMIKSITYEKHSCVNTICFQDGRMIVEGNAKEFVKNVTELKVDFDFCIQPKGDAIKLEHESFKDAVKTRAYDPDEIV